MNELKRSMSIQIPEDWEKIGLTLYNRVKKEGHIKARELGMMSLPADALEPVPVIEDNSYYEYFETILSFSELYEARKKLVNNYVTKENIPPEDLKYSRYYHNFRRWWVLSRYDVDMNGYQLLDFRYSTVCEPALNVFIVTGEAAFAYHVMNKKIRFSNFGNVSVGSES